MTTIPAVCPDWCDGEHLRDPGGDQVHERNIATIPVVMLNRRAIGNNGVARDAEAGELDLVVYQYLDDEEIWVAIVDGEQQRQRLELSLESARRVCSALERLLALAV